MPNSGFFPIKSIDVNLKEGPFTEGIVDNYQVSAVDKDAIDLKNGLQYSNPSGIDHLQTFVQELVAKMNPPLFKNYKAFVSNGNAASIHRVLDAILDKDDVLLSDQFSYTPATEHCKNFKAHMVALKMTNGKTDIDYLTEILKNWSKYYPDYKMPKAFYTIPNGTNPFGIVLTMDDKKKIYALLEKYNFMIIEDDPYGYLTLPKYEPGAPKEATVEEFINDIGPSFLKIDTAGRVIRIETFSKIFAPGLRLGFIVGHEKFINAIMLYTFVVTGQFLAGPSQILLNNTVAKLGGVDGFLKWIAKVRNEYVLRVHKCLTILYDSKPYKEGKFTVMEPEAGMFLTLQFKQDLTELIKETAVKGVIVVNGATMKVGELAPGFDSVEDTRFIRITYASLMGDELEEALNRFIEAVELTI